MNHVLSGLEIVRWELEITNARKELTKAHTYITHFMMTEVELIQEVEKVKNDIETYRNIAAKIDKKDQKEENSKFEQQMRSVQKELIDGK